MKYAIMNMVFWFVCGEIDLSEPSPLGPGFGCKMGNEPKFYETEEAVLQAYSHLGVMQKLVMRPYGFEDLPEKIRGLEPAFIILDEAL